MFGCFALCMLVGHDSNADSGVPLSLQVRLLSRLASYDRNFERRAGAVARVLVVYRKDDSSSGLEDTSLAKALNELDDIGGLPLEVDHAEFTEPDSLAKRCRADRIAVMYLTVGLEADMPRIAAALVGGDVLTVGTNARLAENGAVVGFALEEARPKLVLNLRQARSQNVNFKAEVLTLARLIR
ncbi:MAG: YfiR/HmsC family protein [Polyangiaceae bacterium]